jgi:hypothetical protein
LRLSGSLFEGSSPPSYSTGKPFNVGIQAVSPHNANGLKASLDRMLVFGPAMLLAFS